MNQYITITPFFITFDVIGNCIDIQTIFDYIKSTYKKEVFILNANDYIDNSSRHSSSKSSEGSHSRRSRSKNSSGNSSNKDTEESSAIQSGRQSHSSAIQSDRQSHSSSRSRDNSRSVVKGFKAKIESDLPKLVENKRKFIAAQEKRRAQIEASKNSHKKSSSSKHLVEEKPKFDGQVDVIYIIVNFPYLPKQLISLYDGGIKIDAFFAFKSNGFQKEKLNKTDTNDKNENGTIENSENIILENNTANSMRSGRSIDPKKVSKKAISGFSLDYTNHPNAYPPARWVSLQSEAPVSISFIEIEVGSDAESTFKTVVENVIAIQKTKSGFQEFINGRKFLHIPTIIPHYQNQDLAYFKQYIDDNFEITPTIKSSGKQSNKMASTSYVNFQNKSPNPTVFVDAILFQLKQGDWFPLQNKKPLNKKKLFTEMFQIKSQDVTRKVIVFPQKKQLEPIFEYQRDEMNNSSSLNVDFKLALPSVYEYLYKLIKWRVTYDNMYACKAWCDFLKSPDDVHAYSGQKFDLMISRINKNYKLGLPLNFFEWKDWSLSIEHENASEVLMTAVQEAGLVETYFDDVVGLLFVLVMRPIPRNIGAFVPHVYMPLTMMVNSDWTTNIVESSDKSVFINQNGTISTTKSENELEPPAKKSRIPITPSFVANSFTKGPVNTNLFYQLLPSLKQRFENREEKIYKMPMYLTNSEEFATPYFFENSNMFVHISRNCVHGKMLFNFKAFINEAFQLFSSEDSISILPAENICFFFTFPFSVSVFFYQQSICYDSNKLILKAADGSPIVITNNGDLTFMKDSDTPLILMKNGTIGQMHQKGKWMYVDKNGETYKYRYNKKKGKTTISKVDLPHSSFYDGSKQIKTMIRPDGFDYIITNKGKREIIFKNDITVVRDDNKNILYDIPSFPMIEHNKQNSSLSFEIDKFKCIFNENTAEIHCDEFTVIYKDESIFIRYNSSSSSPPTPSLNSLSAKDNSSSEIFINANSVQFRSGNDVLYADRNGIEKKGELLLPDDEKAESMKKKKIDYIETHWGKLVPIKETYTEAQQMELHRIFSPRFFVIRSDLSATQYFRPDVINLEGYKQYNKTILHPSGDNVNIVTYHQKEEIPFLFIENKTLSKIDRVNRLKTVHIPRPPKKKSSNNKSKISNNNSIDSLNSSSYGAMKNITEVVYNNDDNDSEAPNTVLNMAQFAHTKMNEYARRFQILLTSALARAQDRYIDDIIPPPPPPKEVIRVPPPTPTPRLLEMQHNLYDLSSAGRYNMNYWKCNESEFGYPVEETHKADLSLSPRTKLCDPPRLFKPEKLNKVPSSNISSKPQINRPFSSGFATQKVSSLFYHEPVNKDIFKPKVAQLSKNKIELGSIFIGESKTGELSIKNTTTKPLRYNFSQFDLKDKNANVFRVLTIPGVIMPGLSITVKVELIAKCVDEIDTSFEFRTPFSSSKIQVTAKVVEVPKIERKKKRVRKISDITNDIEYSYEYDDGEEEEEEKKE